MSAALRELYVYWKTADVETALGLVRIAQGALRQAEAGLGARVLVREGPGPVATLMEIYTAAAGIDAALQARIEHTLQAATRGLVQGQRHTEVFRGR